MARWRHIVIHHTAGEDSPLADTAAIRRWHMDGRGWADIAYHRVYERIDGEFMAVSGRPLYMSGAHEPRRNGDGIGCAFVGNFDIEDLPRKQLECGARDIAGLVSALGISLHNISPHRQWKATACPGSRFPFDDLVDMVADLLSLEPPVRTA